MTQIRQGQRLESQKEPKMKPIKALCECAMRNRFRLMYKVILKGENIFSRCKLTFKHVFNLES